jgi:KH/beta-lactamase-domain protein
VARRDAETSEEERGSYRTKLIIEIYNYLKEANIASIEFEGPEIAVYVKNPKFILEKEDKVKELARKLRKRIVVRTDPSVRKSKEETIKFILDNIPEDVGVKPDEILFDDVLGEVRVIADKPGKLMGRGKWFANLVLAQTGWRLVAQRRPPPPLSSQTLIMVFEHAVRMAGERRKALRDIGERIFREKVVGTRYIRLIGLGSFGEVGRSAILVDTGESKVLLDAGASPDSVGKDIMPYFDAPEFRIEELDAVIISHAHIDHIGMLPLLYKYGYRGPTFMTPPTRDIAVLMLKDYIKVARREGSEPPYTEQDIDTLLRHVITVNYGVVTDASPDIKMTFANAGHILGSALVHLHIGQGLHNILYTGDLKYYMVKNSKARRLLLPATSTFQRVETLIMESTYGATEQQPREEAEAQLIETIKRVYERGGKILIPTMAVGRAQEILYVIRNAREEGLIPKEIPVYVDGMIYEVTAIYTAYPELLAPAVRNQIFNEGVNPFVDEYTVYVHDPRKRDEVINEKNPAVILATSGMMTGGPVIEYFKHLASDERNALVFVSYSAPGTLARRIKDGEREIMVEDDGRVRIVRVNMEVESIEGFSGHASRSELLLFLKYLTPKPKHIILNHGEPGALSSLARAIARSWSRLRFQSQPEITVPENLEAIRVYPRRHNVHMSPCLH